MEKRYIEAIGRRKTAGARVRITPAESTNVIVNDKELASYFPHTTLQKTVLSVFGVEEAGVGNYHVTVRVVGGGISAQAEAIRLGIARALVKEKADRRSSLKKEGYLMRDPRSVERKKPGLKKARKSPQWSKR